VSYDIASSCSQIVDESGIVVPSRIRNGVSELVFVGPSKRSTLSDLDHFMKTNADVLNNIKVIKVSGTSGLPTIAPFSELKSLEVLSIHSKLLNSLDGLNSIKSLIHLKIDIKCSQQSLEQISALQLKGLSIRPSKSNDLAFLHGLSTLRSLTLENWPFSSLASLPKLRITDIRMFGGKLEDTDGAAFTKLKFAAFYDCRKLSRLTNINPEVLCLNGFPMTILNEVSKLKHIRTLSLKTTRKLPSFNFLTTLERMRVAEILGSKSIPSKVLNLHNSVEYIVATCFDDEYLALLSAANRKTLFFNGELFYKNGLEMNTAQGREQALKITLDV